LRARHRARTEIWRTRSAIDGLRRLERRHEPCRKGGHGESVWLAFFLYDVLTQFAELARSRNDLTFADRCVTQAQQLQKNIELHGWDGEWYLRAYFDNGERLVPPPIPNVR